MDLDKARKRLEEADKRRQERLQRKVDKFKRKNEKWTKKIKKIKLEQEKKLKEKQTSVQSPTSKGTSSSSNILKSLANRVFGKTTWKPVLTLGEPSNNIPGPLPVHSSQVQELETKEGESRKMDESIKDEEEHLSSFDITAYEEYDEELKHRKGKRLPGWASENDKLEVALFSMVLYPDYQDRLSGGFPKPDKTYQLFPKKSKK